MTANALLCVVGLAPAAVAAAASTQRFSLTNKVLRMIYVLLLCYVMHRHGPPVSWSANQKWKRECPWCMHAVDMNMYA